MHSDTPKRHHDMNMRENRTSLVSRYNRVVGEPGPAAQRVQHEFIIGSMDPRLIPTFVAEYETIIESRMPMRKPTV